MKIKARFNFSSDVSLIDEIADETLKTFVETFADTSIKCIRESKDGNSQIAERSIFSPHTFNTIKSYITLKDIIKTLSNIYDGSVCENS